MSILSSTQRNSLEKAVLAARRTAEQGAINALKALAVHHHEPYTHMNTADRTWRNQLRSKARLLGDRTLPSGGHSIEKLAYELAYEYWHRMLFARFLEANNLLIHPEYGVPVSLDECAELGMEEGHDNKWMAAAYYASRMLPAIFPQDDPLMQINYSTEDRVHLEQILEGIHEDIFRAEDSLGWVYQHWQTTAKKVANDKVSGGGKINAKDLPAVTQLFTEPYMVHFLIDNTLGAWWTARNQGATPPIEFKYLRTLDDGTPAAGKFEGWPDRWQEITMMDPCMGSGHFVVEVFKAMAALRLHDEQLTREEACDAVIRDNIQGLELDDRCTQIAAFNLALTAWKFCGCFRELPHMNLACSGIAPKGKKEDWIKLSDSEPDNQLRTRLQGGLGRMYDLFQQAPELGSLINPTTIQKDLYVSDFDELTPFLNNALESELSKEEDHGRGIVAAGIAKAGRLLAKKYVWQVTNVPYLSRGKQSKTLYDFCEKNYPNSKGDLATVFYEKLLNSNAKGGTTAVVIPQNWLFLVTYKSFRKYLLKNFQLNILGKLGSGAFSQITGEVVKAILISITKKNISEEHRFGGLDVSNYDTVEEKSNKLTTEELFYSKQVNQLKNPDYRIVFSSQNINEYLYNYAVGLQGIATGDYPRYGRFFWELKIINNKEWIHHQSTVKNKSQYGGRENVIFWESGVGELSISENARIQGLQGWKKWGVAISQMSSLNSTIYTGSSFDNNTAAIIPNELEYLPAIWCFCSSPQFHEEVRKIDQALKVTNATLVKVPFDLEYWQDVANKKYPNGLPKPYSDDPTQWLFHGHPRFADHPLQVTIGRMLGYQWPAEYDEEMELSDDAREKIKAIHDLNLVTDEDGIVCIPSVNGELPAAERIREQIIKIWGSDYDADTLRNLLGQEGSNKKNLDSYLRDDFFMHHNSLFNNRPFIWHVWDGLKDGFSALVNYHKLTKTNLEKLIYTYLGDWIRQCELKVQNEVSGAEGLLSAAKALKEQLLLILQGEPPFDLFIRWKTLEEQPIGWEPDLNDGVRLNIYPFVQAGVLRRKFNVKWNKDRGKNPGGSPWGPNRWNRYEDLEEKWKQKDEQGREIGHLTTEIKRNARNKK